MYQVDKDQVKEFLVWKARECAAEAYQVGFDARAAAEAFQEMWGLRLGLLHRFAMELNEDPGFATLLPANYWAVGFMLGYECAMRRKEVEALERIGKDEGDNT